MNTLYSALPPLFRPAKAVDVSPYDFVSKVPPPPRDYCHPWPDALPGLGLRSIGPFDCCSSCERWSWVRYGAVVLCLSCAKAGR